MALTKVSYSMISGETANILDFGADPTGVASSTAALNAAIATGNAVFIPQGTFLLTGQSVVPSGMRIFGVGSSKSRFKCDTTAHTGDFLRVAGGNNDLEHFGMFGTSTAAGTAIYLSAVNVYEFTGYVTVTDVNITEINLGVRINNLFDVTFNNCRIFGNIKGMLVDPQYDGIGDNGYFTTLTLNKTYINQNSDYGFKATPTIVSKNLCFRDSVIESNTGVTSGYQSYIENTDPLYIENCYFEAEPTIPFMRLFSCVTFINQAYVNGTGGLDLQATSNELVAFRFRGTASTDKIIATGTILQKVEFWDSVLGTSTNINSSRQVYRRTFVGATFYENYLYELGLTLAQNSGVTNTSRQKEVLLYKRTVTATVPANDRVALITDQTVPNLWNDDFAIGLAQITSSYQPDLIYQVTTATTGSTEYFCVFARNFSASPITLTNQLLKIMFVKGSAMAI
jgi:hypothetical protein